MSIRLKGKDTIILPRSFGNLTGCEGYGIILKIDSATEVTVRLDNGKVRCYPTRDVLVLRSPLELIKRCTRERGYHLSADERQNILHVLELAVQGKSRKALEEAWSIKENAAFCTISLEDLISGERQRKRNNKGKTNRP